MHKLKNHLEKALTTSFIDQQVLSDQSFQTELLYNDYKRGSKILRSLQDELLDSQAFMFSVAFITESGLSVLANQLKYTIQNKIPGKILTSDYLMFNDPKTFRKLLSYPNIEVKILEGQALHSKGYIFKKENSTSLILGSSNLTANALTKNSEWNLKLSSLNHGKIIQELTHEFEYLWTQARKLDEEWIIRYEKQYRENHAQSRNFSLLDNQFVNKQEGYLLAEEKDTNNSQQTSKLPQKTPFTQKEQTFQNLSLNQIKKSKEKPIYPNKMQIEALKNIQKLREKGKDKALLISSTGTGKTYLSAFDVRNFNPKKMLFIIHREQIALEALASFQKVMPHKNYGMLSGRQKDYQADYLFTTIQSLAKTSSLEQFSPSHFDYIIIDEAHHTGAKSYHKILNYFKPSFLLGMTATPERSDDYNIYKLFDYNIAYEIRLQQALEEDMLAPFHYFGVSDLTVDGKSVDDKTKFNDLVSEQRVNHILEESKFYGHSGDYLKGLIFVSRNKEAEILSKKMNEKGYKTIHLSGSNSQKEREDALKKLSQNNNELNYIITVDIFNEGVDIPDLNQIIMLRPTQSAIVFVQQLGRGLRKHPEKDYVVIIDFIGNYKNNFMIPIALSGDQSYKKDDLKKFLMEGSSTLPGSSVIDFEPIIKQQIYASLDQQNFSTLSYIENEYQRLKRKIGRVPKLVDFLNYEAMNPQVIFKHKQLTNYHKVLKQFEDNYPENISPYENQVLDMFSLEFSNGKRLDEINLIEKLVKKEKITDKEISTYKNSNLKDIFSLDFFTQSDQKKYGSKSIIILQDQELKFNQEIQKSLKQNPYFKKQLEELIEYTKLQNKKFYHRPLEHSQMVLYEQYTRKDMCRLFNWDKDEKGTIYGYRFKHNTYPIFVTYHKDDDISETTKYEDEFINSSNFSWMTKSRRNLDSQDVKDLQFATENQLPIDLFVKKDDGEKGEFYYLGPMSAISYQQESMADKKGTSVPVVNVIFEMNYPVRKDILNYFMDDPAQ